MRRQRFRDELQSGEVLALDPSALTLVFGSAPPRDVKVTDDGVAIMTIEGPLEHRRGGCWDSYEAILERFEENIAREDVRTLVLRIDSPGGETDGLLETVRALRDAKEASGKPVLAYADECAASAAYAIACAADEIYLPEAAGVGSIGVISTLLEMTARDEKEGLHFELIASGLRKTDGNPHTVITDGARRRATARVQQLAGLFFELVADARGMSVDDVDELEADVFYGQSAVDLGIADEVLTWPEVLERARSEENYTARLANGTASNRPAPARGGDMNKLEALKAKKTAAKGALAKATTEKAKREAGTSYRKACVALAVAEASIEARKMKKTKYVEETLDDSSESEAEDEAEDAEDDAEEASDADDEAEDDEAKHTVTVEHEDDDEEDDDEEDDDDAKHAKKMQRAGQSGMSLEATLAKLTGKRSRSAMIGAIEGAFRAAEQARLDVSKMKSERKAEKIERLLTEAKESGKVTRGELPSLRQAATTNGVGWLKANLEQRPAIVRREELMPKQFEGLAGKVPADVALVFAKMGLSKEQAEKAGALFAERNGQNGVTR